MHLSRLILTVLLPCLLFALAPSSGEGAASADETIPSIAVKKKQEQGMSWVRFKQAFPGKFVTNGPRNDKRVSLTFDDAPDPRFTPQILEILREKHVRATFFVVGFRAEEHAGLIQRIHNEGHEIGNHSYNHPNYARLSAESFHRQIIKTDNILRRLTGYSSRFIRPPYGELLPSQMKWLSSQGYTVVNWDVDSVDWRNSSSSRVLDNIRSTLRPGSIILQHAGGGNGQDLSGTIAALPALIEELEEQGYVIVPLSELLGQPKTRE